MSEEGRGALLGAVSGQWLPGGERWPRRLEEPVIPRAASRRDSSVRNSPRGGAAAPAAAAQPTSPGTGQCVQPTSPGSSARSSCVGGCHVAPGSMRSSRPDLPESSSHSSALRLSSRMSSSFLGASARGSSAGNLQRGSSQVSRDGSSSQAAHEMVRPEKQYSDTPQVTTAHL